jgi:hypothetical protein
LSAITDTWIQRTAQDWLVLELGMVATPLDIATGMPWAPTLLL